MTNTPRDTSKHKTTPQPAPTPGVRVTATEDTGPTRERPVDQVMNRGGDAAPSPRAPDTGEGGGARNLHVGGDRLGKQLDENQSQSDRNPGEGANRDAPDA